METAGGAARIDISLDDVSFQYDVHSLTKAFYPEAEVKILADEVSAQEDPLRTETGNGKLRVETGNGKLRAETGNGKLRVETGNGKIRVSSGWIEDIREVPQGTSRPEVKNILKRALYRVLSEVTGKSLPWGTLSGIRPVKIAMKILAEGGSEEDVRERFRNTYFTDASRAELTLSIAQRERNVIFGKERLSSGKYPEEGAEGILSGYSLYISLPFCPSICLYCSFPSGTIGKMGGLIEPYLKTLDRELQFVAGRMRGKKLISVYIGGGTPTALMPAQLGSVLAKTAEYFDLSHLLEYTVEAGRPDTITKEHLDLMMRYGVNRISVNPQTMHQRTLDLIGRAHTAEAVREAFYKVREAGCRDINMDIILGLPGEDDHDVMATLSAIREMDPEALTVHSLALKRSSRLYEEREKYLQAGCGITESLMDRVIEEERTQGRLPYYLYRQKNISGNLENIGFSKIGNAGLYNILMMEEIHTVMACGAGSVTKVVTKGEKPVSRAADVSEIAQYIERIDEMCARKDAILSAAAK